MSTPKSSAALRLLPARRIASRISRDSICELTLAGVSV
jgi:hypothetical protein